ncbi:hypothetical protein CcaverHIS002_0303490 [Cutaneotrichosporon cavernicola]|nr:hypothetical protein CcaverHIS002_0303490 [Cutaneotrichosporon cavernicola]
MSNLLPQAPPLIGLSQAMRYSFAEEEATQTQRAHIALSQYTSEVGLEAGDGFHFSSQRPCEASSSPPQTPPARRTFQGGGYSQPFRHGVGPQPAGSRPRHTAGGDSTRSAAGDSQRLSRLASKRRGSGGARPSPPRSDSDNGDDMCTPSSTLGRLVISSPGPSPGSPTRRAQQEVIDLCSSSPSPPRAYSPFDWEYGDGAVLEFDPGGRTGSTTVQTTTSDAGLKLSDIEWGGDDIEWGGDAVLVWDGEYDDGDEVRFVEQGQGSEYEDEGDEGDEEDEDEEEDEELGEDDYEVHDIDGSDDEASSGSSNRMPVYNNWDIPKLQHLVKGYGYRPSKDRKVLVKLATECWAALHPAPKSRTKNKGKQTKPKPKLKTKAANDEAVGPVGPDPALDILFYNLLTSDDALYARILRYEPLPFDELVSHAVAAGINSRGWRPRLKKFLDLKGVTYFTADPTAPRRRY